nr:hypothetical protein [Tanacetum cinerariifolium]
RHASLVAVVPRGNGDATHPVDECSRHGAVNASVRVDVVGRQQESGAHNTLGGICQRDVVEQKLVDGATGLPALPELLDMGQGVRVVGCLCRS